MVLGRKEKTITKYTDNHKWTVLPLGGTVTASKFSRSLFILSLCIALSHSLSHAHQMHQKALSLLCSAEKLLQWENPPWNEFLSHSLWKCIQRGCNSSPVRVSDVLFQGNESFTPIHLIITLVCSLWCTCKMKMRSSSEEAVYHNLRDRDN